MANKKFSAGILIITAAILAGGGFLLSKSNDAQENNNQANERAAKLEFRQDDHVRGEESAPITILEYSDFQCPFCFKFHQTMLKIMDDYPGKIKWVYRHFPLDSIHPNARRAAEASECAAEQEKFWEFADGLFGNQAKLGFNYYKELAQGLDLDMAQFEQCVSSRKYKSEVNKDLSEGISLGIRGTPGNFINGQPLGGALSYEQLKAFVENLLSE